MVKCKEMLEQSDNSSISKQLQASIQSFSTGVFPIREQIYKNKYKRGQERKFNDKFFLQLESYYSKYEQLNKFAFKAT